MRFKPLKDRLLIKRLQQQSETTSGIIIPESASEKPDSGVVLAVGDGKQLNDGSFIPMQVEFGDEVIFSKYAGQAITINGEELLIIREDEILGILEE